MRLKRKWVAAGMAAIGLCCWLGAPVSALGPPMTEADGYAPPTVSSTTRSPSARSSGTVRLTNADAMGLRAEQEELLTQYITDYYDALASLKAGNPTSHFASDAKTNAQYDKANWELMVELRKMAPVDLSLSSYKILLTGRSISRNSDGDIEMLIREDSYQNFKAYPGITSEHLNISHYFIITNTGQGWRIKAHRQVDGFNSAFHQVIQSAGGQANTYILADAKKQFRDRASQAQQYRATTTSLTWDHDYNRQAAVAYSQDWVGQRRPGWPAYDRAGGNCANFVSQCLYAGGIPMDYVGAAQWKWYGNQPNSSQQATGRSASWSSVSAFYTYAKSNTGYGLVADVGANYYSGEVGDVLQMGMLNNWRHTVIISQVIKENGKTVDYLVNSNTADQRNFPVSAYPYTMQRLIKIYGWNGVPPEEEQEETAAEDVAADPIVDVD